MITEAQITFWRELYMAPFDLDPSLKDRPEDLLLLVDKFPEEYSAYKAPFTDWLEDTTEQTRIRLWPLEDRFWSFNISLENYIYERIPEEKKELAKESRVVLASTDGGISFTSALTRDELEGVDSSELLVLTTALEPVSLDLGRTLDTQIMTHMAFDVRANYGADFHIGSNTRVLENGGFQLEIVDHNHGDQSQVLEYAETSSSAPVLRVNTPEENRSDKQVASTVLPNEYDDLGGTYTKQVATMALDDTINKAADARAFNQGMQGAKVLDRADQILNEIDRKRRSDQRRRVANAYFVQQAVYLNSNLAPGALQSNVAYRGREAQQAENQANDQALASDISTNNETALQRDQQEQATLEAEQTLSKTRTKKDQNKVALAGVAGAGTAAAGTGGVTVLSVHVAGVLNESDFAYEPGQYLSNQFFEVLDFLVEISHFSFQFLFF